MMKNPLAKIYAYTVSTKIMGWKKRTKFRRFWVKTSLLRHSETASDQECYRYTYDESYYGSPPQLFFNEIAKGFKNQLPVVSLL